MKKKPIACKQCLSKRKSVLGSLAQLGWATSARDDDDGKPTGSRWRDEVSSARLSALWPLDDLSAVRMLFAPALLMSSDEKLGAASEPVNELHPAQAAESSFNHGEEEKGASKPDRINSNFMQIFIRFDAEVAAAAAKASATLDGHDFGLNLS